MQTTVISTPPGVSVSNLSWNLEAIRGGAALLVVWHHAISFPKLLDPNYTLTGFFGYLAPSHFSVLIFFVLSGYVIGLSNRQPLTRTTIKAYLRKRIIRIYPIYIVAMVAAAFLGAFAYSWTTVLANFVFLQILLTPVMRENAPSWSLHFEVLYYLLFVPISFFRLSPLLTTVAALIVGVVHQWFFPASPLLSSYAFGLVFWLAGLATARYTERLPIRPVSYQKFLALLLLFASFRAFDAPESLLRRATEAVVGQRLVYQHTDTFLTILPFYDLAWLPYALLGVILFTQRSIPFQRWIVAALFLLPGLTLISMFRQWATLDIEIYGMSTCFYVLSILLLYIKSNWFETLGKAVIARLSAIAGISYGLYIIHFPVLMFLHKIPYLSGSGLTFGLRFIVFIGLSFLLATWLEKYFQPWIRARLS